MRYIRILLLYTVGGAWLFIMAVLALVIDSAGRVHRWLRVAVFVFVWSSASAQQPTDPLYKQDTAYHMPAMANELEYVGPIDTLFGFAVVLVAFEPKAYSGAEKKGGVEYALQPFPAYALKWKKGFRDAEFFYLSGVRIPSSDVFLFKIRELPKD